MGNAYLVAYNTACFLGWLYCLYLTIKTVWVEHGGTKEVWQVVELPLKISQTAALLEIVHSALGIVRSPVAITAMQVASRIWIVWGIIHPVQGPTTASSVNLFQVGGFPVQLNLITLMTAWCITEVIRYCFFAFKELGSVPYVLQWLRYTVFIPLYPLGVASELSMVYLAWPSLWASQLWSFNMPTWFNFAFNYPIGCLIGVLLYLPGLPMLYLYMLTQRRKVLSGASTGGGKTKAA